MRLRARLFSGPYSARRKAAGLPVGRPKGRATKLMLDDRRAEIVDYLNNPTIPNPEQFQEEEREFNRYTLLGEYDDFFVALLVERCRRKGVSKRSVAKILSCSPTTLYSWIRRRRISGR